LTATSIVRGGHPWISAPTSKQSIALPIGTELGDTKDRHVPGLVGVSGCLVGAIRPIDDCLVSAIFMLLLLVDFYHLTLVMLPGGRKDNIHTPTCQKAWYTLVRQLLSCPIFKYGDD
jgi:hypothetical protein